MIYSFLSNYDLNNFSEELVKYYLSEQTENQTHVQLLITIDTSNYVSGFSIQSFN